MPRGTREEDTIMNDNIPYDPDHIDVADIMARIKRRVAEAPPAPAGTPASPETALRTFPAATGPGGWKGLVKKGVRFLLRPYMPYLGRLYDRFVFKTTLDVNVRLDKVATRLGTTMETTKLLHNLSHNLVLELTKLKVENDGLKSKMRVMEKDFEMLGKRERVLEKRVVE
jgi:hypothetical protein